MLAVVLSDRDLRESVRTGRLRITPFDESAIQPSSIDLRLGTLFRVFVNQSETHIDPKLEQSSLTKEVDVSDNGMYVAGDVASREDVTGAVSGGGAVNSSWAGP